MLQLEQPRLDHYPIPPMVMFKFFIKKNCKDLVLLLGGACISSSLLSLSSLLFFPLLLLLAFRYLHQFSRYSSFYVRLLRKCALTRSGSELLDPSSVTHSALYTFIFIHCICVLAQVPLARFTRSGSELLGTAPVQILLYRRSSMHIHR